MRRRLARLVVRLALGAVVLGAAAGAVLRPVHRDALGTVALGALLVLGMSELFTLGLERLVGMRYLHRARKPRGTGVALVLALGLVAAGFAIFFATHGRSRAGETIGIISVLVAALAVVVVFLLRVFSVFTTVSTMGVVLGVASLIVVLGVTSGFEREFQDKVLALNAHLIVIPYGDVDIDSPEADTIADKLRGMPGVERMAKFLFSAGEVMVGNIGANLKGIDLKEGADDLRHALIEGRVEDLATPASCPLPQGATGKAATDVGRIVLGAELAHKLHVKTGGCVSIMVPFSSTGAVTPPSFLFKVVGLFRMGFNEYDTRLAYVSLADARKIANARGSVFGVELRFKDPMMALTMTGEVKRRLDAPYRVIDWKELNHNLFMALTMQKVIISLLLVLIIVVAAFNIIASLTMIVLSKVREIAILKSMGARASTVARIFLVGGTTVGAIGTGMGILYGLLVCLLARLYGYPLDPKVYLIGQLPVQISASDVVLVAVATLGICFLSTLYPALRASRLRAVDGLRYN
ncbi:MAG TPA: ABC transporter permease [Polyangia bacterium]|nr:ABC transporter permease [Polyangia bacterium]